MFKQDPSREDLLLEIRELQEKYDLLKKTYDKDIAQYRSVSENLENERILLRTLIDNLPDTIYTKDLACRKTLANKAELRILKAHSEAEVLGKDDYAYYPKELADRFFADDQSVLITGKSVINREEYIPEKNGQERWLLSSKIPIFDKNNQIIGLLGIGREITERKQAELLLQEQKEEIEAQNEEYQQINEELRQINEELLQARAKAEESDQLKTVFLQNMSHEFRTPLNAIMGFSEILTQQFHNKEKLEKYSRIIYQTGNDLLEIINEVMDISRLEAGQMQVHPEEFPVLGLFEELQVFFNEYQERINKQDITIRFEHTAELKDVMIVTDKGKLKQIFINLINNALKYTYEGEICFGCTINSQSKQLDFFVSDTGVGIPPEKLSFIFERFAQIRQLKGASYRGTGLGLSIVKGLVTLLGGDIWVESEPDRGSTFSFSLPA